MYSIARLRFPADSIIRKVEKALEEKFVEFESKDTALLAWSFARLMKKQSNRYLLRSKIWRIIKLGQEEEGYFLSEENSLLNELEMNIIQQDFRQCYTDERAFALQREGDVD